MNNMITLAAIILALVAIRGFSDDPHIQWQTMAVTNQGYSVSYPSTWTLNTRKLGFCSFAASSPKTPLPMSITINREPAKEWATLQELVESAQQLITRPSPADHQRCLKATTTRLSSGYDAAVIEIESTDTNMKPRTTQVYVDTKDGGYLGITAMTIGGRTDEQDQLLAKIVDSIILKESPNKGLLRTGDPQTARQSAEP